MNRFEASLTLKPLGPGAQYLWLCGIATLGFAAIGSVQIGLEFSIPCSAVIAGLHALGISRVAQSSASTLGLDANGSLWVSTIRQGRSLHPPGSWQVERMPGIWFFGVSAGTTLDWIPVADHAMSQADRVRLAWRLPLQ